MKIDSIYICCYKYDVRLVRILVASIRKWYEQIPIFLVKDIRYGPFDTSELERVFHVSVFKSGFFGWGFGHVEVLVNPLRQRCLLLDADIIMAGPVIEELEKSDEDFIVQYEKPSDDFVKELYFDLEKLKGLDPEFRFPGFTFNTGQMVITTGIIKKEDFDPFIIWSEPPSVRHPEIFKCGDQGLLNYILLRKLFSGALSLKRVRFMEVADDPAAGQIDKPSLEQGLHKFVVHWCGKRGDICRPSFSGTPNRQLLLNFEDEYYKKLPLGSVKRTLRNSSRYGLSVIKRQIRSLLGKENVPN
jgi:hypothetical protein